MNPFFFSGMGAVSFGIDRIKQLADDILTLNGSRVPVVLISDAGVARAGILGPVLPVARLRPSDDWWIKPACPVHWLIKQSIPRYWPN